MKFSRKQGFTLVEAIVVVAVIAIVTSVVVPMISGLRSSVNETQLTSDVDSINRAISVYRANGGNLDGVTTPQQIVDKLKSRRTDGGAARFAGYSGSVVDMRLAVRPVDPKSDQPRAVWNSAVNRFEIATSGTGVEFSFDDSLAEVDYGTETRAKSALDWNPDRGWIWTYRDRARAKFAGATVVPLADVPGSAPPPVISRQTLSPPVFSPPAGTYPAADFPMAVTLNNPNDPGTWIMVSVGGGPFARFGAPLSVPADTPVNAFADGDPALWLRSTTVGAFYRTPSAAPLQVPVISLSDSKFTDSVQAITVTLTNPNPAGSSSLEYAIIQPTGTLPALASYLPYTSPVSVPASSYPDGFHVSTYAKSLDTASYLDSATVEGQTTSEFFGVELGSRVLLVLDASGSMNSSWANTKRFNRVVKEAIDAIQALGSTTKFGVITFNSGIHWSDGSNELKEATPDNKQAAISALGSLTAAGGTNYEVGLSHAAAMSEPPSHIIFLSDGLPNQRNYLDEISALAGMGIKIDTIGIGKSQSQGPLDEMASLAGGSYTFVGEPGSGGTLHAPVFSVGGDSFDHDKFPISLALTDPNSSNPASRILYSLNGGPYQPYAGPISVGYDTTVDAYSDSTDPVWAPSSVASESYQVKEYSADRPEISLSTDKFKDDNLTITINLNDRNEAGLTNLVWWFETQPESSATEYTGPFTLSAADWNTFAGELVKDVKLLARAVPAQSFVTPSSTEDEGVTNETTAFLLNLKKDPLERPVFSVDGNKFNYPIFPISLTLENPNSGVGEIQVSINGGAFAPYSGAISCDYNTEVTAYVKSGGPGSSGFKSSETQTESYLVGSVGLARPQISLSDDEFEGRNDTITVVITNPNPADISNVIYWFEGQDEETQAIPYTGPITLNAADWESYVPPGKGTAKLLARAVGTESFVKDSDEEDAKFENDN